MHHLLAVKLLNFS